MQNIKQFVKEPQEIKSLQTSESHFFTFPTKIYGVSVKRCALQKTVQVDTRFYPDTNALTRYLSILFLNIYTTKGDACVCVSVCVCVCKI